MRIMETIKIYYKGELDRNLDDFLKDVFGKRSYLLIGSGYNFKEEERDLEFEYAPSSKLGLDDPELLESLKKLPKEDMERLIRLMPNN